MAETHANSRKKIAILGGGVGAMSAAAALTDPSNPQRDLYDITVYQMGWRLGGKGASGRNLTAPYGARIEEHGLHIWFGFYDNAFRLMQQCYGELNRPHDAPLATWQDAFKPHSFIVVEEKHKDGWVTWASEFPTNDAVPGDGVLLPVWEYLRMLIEWMHSGIQQSSVADIPIDGDDDIHLSSGLQRALNELTSEIETTGVSWGVKLLALAAKLSRDLSDDALDLGAWLKARQSGLAQWLGRGIEDITHWIDSGVHEVTHDVIIKLLKTAMGWYWHHIQGVIDSEDTERHLWILMNLAFANLSGIIEDDLLIHGFDSINHLEYREWLSQYVYPDGGLTINSPILASAYDALFAYDGGDLDKPNLEAGTAVRAAMRQLLTYRGAIMWKMQAGMGDTVFTPIYQVLKKRGVQFEFFHKVKRLNLNEDGSLVDSIDIGVQATVKPDIVARGGYSPLVEVKGLPCWPSTPQYEQLVEGTALEEGGVNLEALCTDWQDVGEKRLALGKDFDLVLLAIPIAALPMIAPDLIARSQAWQQAVAHVGTVRTQAFQMWLTPTAYELGWELMGQPVLSSYDVTPLDTWGDMSHLAEREAWPAAPYPQSIAYFCGPMKDDHAPDFSDTDAECRSLRAEDPDALTKAAALAFIKDDLKQLWPKAFSSGQNGSGFDWRLLLDLREKQGTGVERFDAQYWRANVSPAERYTLSLVGSSRHRLPAHNPDEYTNLFLAGDWIQNRLNFGSVEAATISGLLAAQAMSGYPEDKDIIGLNFG